MTIQGTSSMHDWESDVTEVNGAGLLEAANGTIAGISELSLEIPVKSIKSGKGSTMDNKTYEAFKSEEHPTITYKLTEVKSIMKESDGYLLKTVGDLTMAGSTRSIEMDVHAKSLGSGDWQFEGAKALKMTDFNMEPPKALMGTLKTGDEVTINFSINMKPSRS